MMLGIVLLGDPNYVAHAMEAVAEMRARGLRPRTDTFNTLMQTAISNADFLQVSARRRHAPVTCSSPACVVHAPFTGTRRSPAPVVQNIQDGWPNQSQN